MTLRVLIVVVPRMFRNTLERVLKEERPNLEVRSADPQDLDREISRFEPQLLLCSELSPKVEEVVISWIHVLYKDSLTANVRVGERRSTLQDPSFEDLLCVIDETQRLAGDDRSARY